MQTIKNMVRGLPTWAKIIAVFGAMAIVGSFVDDRTKVATPTKTSQSSQASPGPISDTINAKPAMGVSVEEVVKKRFDKRALGATYAQAILTIDFEAARFETKNIERDVKIVMNDLAKAGVTFDKATINAHYDMRDQYGKVEKTIVYTATIAGSEAAKVRDWLGVNVQALFDVSYKHAQLTK